MRSSGFARDVVLATLTAIATGIALFVVTRLLARGLGPAEFGAYSLARRFVATATSVASLGMGVAVARYIAVAGDSRSRQELLIAGFLLGVLPSILILGLGGWNLGLLNALIFRGASSDPVCRAMLVLLVGTTSFSLLFAYYRGSGQIGKASLWQLAAIGVGPTAVAWLAAPAGAATVLAWMAVLQLAALIPLALGFGRPPRGLGSGAAVRSLAKYGAPRVPGAFALASLLGIGPLLAPHFAAVEDAGFLTVGQAVFALADSAVAGFGIVVLPRAARALVEGREASLREGISDALAFALQVGTFSAVQLLIWSREIVDAWLGHEYARAVPLMRILLVSLTPYIAYTMLRSFVDALETNAVNTVNLLVALAVSIGVSLGLGAAGVGARGLASATAAGIVVLGAGTFAYLRRAGWLDLSRLRLWPALGLTAGLSAFALVGRGFLSGRWSDGVTLAIGAAMEVALFAVYFMVLRRLRVGWTLRVAPLEGR